MSSLGSIDLASLAHLAQRRDREIRPLLLRLHARAFASAPFHDRQSLDTFAALACGLLPLVPGEAAAEVAAILGDSPDIPPALRRLLDARVGSERDPVRSARSEHRDRAGIDALLAIDRRDVDLALARNEAIVLDGRALALLVERARQDGPLAAALLGRPEPGPLDRASLYPDADTTTRARIRQSLERAAAAGAQPVRPLSDARRARLLKRAAAGDLPKVLAELGKALAIASVPAWRLDREAEAELFALALLAAGLERADRCTILLTAHPALARSVPAVFGLDEICRTTSAAVAGCLVGAGSAPRRRRPAPAEAAPVRKRPPLAAGARAASASDPSPAPRVRSPAGSARPDRRSRSTRGRDRS